MLLNELFENAPSVEISQLSCDSRIKMKDCIFFCYKGIKYNGHQFIDEAISNGATVIVYEDEIVADRKAIYIRVSNVTDVLIQVAARFYDYPSKNMETFITVGSYGRSTVSHLLSRLISFKKNCGSIGVTGIIFGDNNIITNAPTLTVLDNCRYLRRMKDSGFDSCVFEANALSLSYHKLDHLEPKCFIFTSTGYQSKDYREVGKEYFEIMRRYLYTLENDTLIVLNRDDVSFAELSNVIGDKSLTYGYSEESDVIISNVSLYRDGSSFDLFIDNKTYSVSTRLIGEKNVQNVTAAITALYGCGYDINEVIENLKTVNGPDGVFERVPSQRLNAYIDCAKNLESIESVLKDLKEIKDPKGRAIALVSVNSYDDDQKLQSIVKLCEKYVDLTVYTEDNSEDGEMQLMLDKIATYVHSGKSLLVEKRKEAIEIAVNILNSRDVLAVLGKGSENFLIRSLNRDYYETDKINVLNYLKKRVEEENHTEYHNFV